MPKHLFPVMYKPGIKRDGTNFQSEYCFDGQWVRFVQGNVRKQGGQKGMNVNFTTPANCMLMATSGANQYYAFIGTSDRITKLGWNDNFLQATPAAPIIPAINNRPDLLWQFEIITTGPVGAPVRTLVCFAADNAVNINQNSAPLLYSGPLNSPLFNTQLTATAINPLANGGICFAVNGTTSFLFIYGSNGYVAHSQSANPFLFVGGDANAFTISDDKVIYGKAIRGGSNSPSILFWTMSSVVRLTNVGDQQMNFKTDVLTRSSTILSSKCVVEYGPFFFWPGSDRKFYVYNGVVDEVDNNQNQNYFFDNLDMAQRQKVFGVKNAQYSEVWWFYPERNQTSNSRAIIYNIKLNCWYDTAISRTCGTFFADLGMMCTYGTALSTADNRYYLWQHEVGTDQDWYPNFLGGTTQIISTIPSFFSLPWFSWAAFNPMKQLVGNDRWIELQRIEPDFLMDTDTDAINVVIHTKEYAQSTDVPSNALQLVRITEKLDMNYQGRHMYLEFISNGKFEMGHVMLLLAVGDGQ